MTTYKRPIRFTSRMIRAAGDRIAQRTGGRRLCILSYHRVLDSVDPILASEPDARTFRWQMELLADCFNVLPLHNAVLALASDDVPPRAVCITFDDGYRSVHDTALPILKELNLPATVFVTTGCMSEENMWNDRIIEAVRRLPNGQLDMRGLGLDLGLHTLASPDDRNRIAHCLIETSKYLAPFARNELTKKIEGMAGDVPTHNLMLTREMVRELIRHDIEIGGHTISHPILKSINDDEAQHEIAGNKHHLESITGKPVRLFAYPNGKPNLDFDENHVQMVKQAGYTAAFTTATGAATNKHDRYQLPRSRPWDSTPLMYGARLLRWLQG